jgi:hypothetical protein
LYDLRKIQLPEVLGCRNVLALDQRDKTSDLVIDSLLEIIVFLAGVLSRFKQKMN